ncbi:envelope protein UL78 [Aotine betaherpesvirus 1]|uniref:Envelope protein UL78 n=1 Tax=Aotine betaherpesvirus 1 TaxID=50290 RepID=G8XUE4_9BETA|nr:envelope protein UL78 [Aotine betaherpesvirus 1]AEV80774.1 envelope protein UL78 [Aotine betaherpesvirus 1]
MFGVQVELLFHGAMMGLLLAGAVLLIMIVGICFLAAKRGRVPYAVSIFVWNLFASQLLTAAAMLFTNGLVTNLPVSLSVCRSAMYLEDVGTCATSLLFLFLIMDRLSALVNGRAEWKHQSHQNVAAAAYAAFLGWFLALVVAISTQAVVDVSRRFPYTCEIPLGYSAFDMSVHVWFLLAAPLIIVLAYVLEICYGNQRDGVWPYIKTVWVFYALSAVFFVPYMALRVIRSLFGVPVDFPEALDYVEIAFRALAALRVCVYPLCLLYLSTYTPMEEFDNAFAVSCPDVRGTLSRLLSMWRCFLLGRDEERRRLLGGEENGEHVGGSMPGCADNPAACTEDETVAEKMD